MEDYNVEVDTHMKAYKALVHANRDFNKTRGAIAYLSWNHSVAKKATVRTSHITRVVMTEPLVHDLFWPPHCRAHVRQTNELKSKLNPGRSSCSRISFQVAGGYLMCFGTRKNSRTMPTTGPPTGRLIQKHHRQLISVVKAPPIRGPITVEAINTVIQRPIRIGCLLGCAT